MSTSSYELRKYIDIITEQENLITSNLEIIKSLVKPEVQARFRDRAKQNPRQAAGTLQHQLQAVRNLAQWEDPLTILQYALNVGANPEELVKIMPQNMDLRSAPPQGTMSQHNQQLLKMSSAATDINVIKEQTNKISQLTQLWDKFAEENPNVKLALDLIPVTGIPTSAIDTAAYLDKQEYGMAALAALGMVPGIKPLMKLAAFKLTPQQLAQHNNLVKASKMAQWSDRAVDTTQYAANQSYPTTPPEMGPAP